jgi:hypothetical protein
MGVQKSKPSFSKIKKRLKKKFILKKKIKLQSLNLKEKKFFIF